MLDWKLVVSSLIGVDFLNRIMAGVVATLCIFTRIGRSRSGWKVDRLTFMAMMVEGLVVSTGVGFAVPAIRSVVKKYRRNPVQVQTYILRPCL